MGLCDYNPKSDPAIDRIRQQLISRYCISEARLDTPEKVLDHAVRVAENQFQRGPNSEWVRYLREKEGIRISWIFDDGDPSTTHDAELRQRSLDAIGKKWNALTGQGLRPNTAEFSQRLLAGLRQFISEERSGQQDGLGIHYINDYYGQLVEREPVELFAPDRGENEKRPVTSCPGFAALFAGVTILAGFHPLYFEKRRPPKGEGRTIYHEVTGVRYDSTDKGKIAFADPLHPELVIGMADAGEMGVEISAIEFLAGIHVNRMHTNHVRLESGQRIVSERAEIQTALRYAPGNFSVYYDAGSWLLHHPGPETDREEQAAVCFRKVLELNPDYPGRRNIEAWLSEEE